MYAICRKELVEEAQSLGYGEKQGFKKKVEEKLAEDFSNYLYIVHSWQHAGTK